MAFNFKKPTKGYGEKPKCDHPVRVGKLPESQYRAML
jgi:hypothetical protein